MNARDETFRYYNPVQISLGTDIYIDELQKIIGNHGARIGLFYGRSAMKKIGAVENITSTFGGCEIREYGSISSNPDIRDVNTALLNSIPKDLDWIIAIGGGSVIDFGKSLAFLSRQQHTIESFLEKRVDNPNPGVPVIAIPTTSGTGSEVTPWATIWDYRKLERLLVLLL